MVTIQEGLSLIDENIHALPLGVYVPLEEACGRVLAEDIYAIYDLPGFDNSAMDGFALSAATLGEKYKVTGHILAGECFLGRVEEGCAVRIMTGAPLPLGGEVIVPLENTTVEETDMSIHTLPSGNNIRRQGEDVTKNSKIALKGDRITPSLIALFSSQGLTHVPVKRRPKVAVLATGSELVPHFSPLTESKLYNSNTLFLSESLKTMGCDVDVLQIKEDTLSVIEEAFGTIKNRYDLIVTSGGASIGDADFTYKALKNVDFIPLFDKVAIKPGKPTKVGLLGSSAVLVLPGNPHACAVNFLIFGRALVRKLQGMSLQKPFAVPLAKTFNVKKGVDTVVVGHLGNQGFMSADKQGPNMVSALAGKNSFIILSAQKGGGEKGEIVECFMVDNYGFE